MDWVKKNKIPAAIFALALLLRGAYLFSIRNHPLTNLLYLDAEYYVDWAKRIAAGNWMGDRIFFFNPLYAYILAVLRLAFGDSLFPIRVIQILCGSLSATVVYLIIKKFHSKPWSALGGALMAVYPVLIFMDSLILKDALAVFLMTVILYLAVRVDFARWGRQDALRWAGAGIVLGAASLLRGNFLMLFPFMVGAIPFCPGMDRKKAIVSGALFSVSFFGSLFPCALRNYLVERDIVLVAYAGGSSFYQGNFPGATGGTETPAFIRDTSAFEEQDPKREAERRAGRPLKPSEVSRFWAREGVSYLGNNPKEAVKLYIRKFLVFWNDYEISGNINYYFMKQVSPVLKFLPFRFGWLAPFGLWGIWLTRRQWRQHILFYFVFLGYMLSIVLYHIEERYRLPIVPILIFFSIPAFKRVAEMWVARKVAGLEILALLGIFLICNLKNQRLIPYHNFSREHDALSVFYMGRKDYRRAGENILMALKESPANFRYVNRLADIYQKTGQPDKALAALDRSLALKPDEPETYRLMSDAYAAAKKYPEAEEALRRYQALSPEDQEAFSKKAILAYRRGDYAEAVKAFLDWAKAVPEDAFRAYNNLGLCYKKMGDLKSAEKYYRLSIQSNPRYATALYNLGLVYLQKGDRARARAQFAKTLGVEPGHPRALQQLRAIDLGQKPDIYPNQ